MVFAVWYSLWIMRAADGWTLVYPGLALITRSAYLNRLRIVRWYTVAVGLVMFAWLCLDKPVADSATLALKSVAFSALIIHFSLGLTRVRMQHLPWVVAVSWHLGMRYWRIVLERLDDMTFALKARWHGPESSWRRKIVLLLSAVGNIVIELVVLVRQLTMVIHARGRLAHPREWKEDPRGGLGSVIGDCALLLVIVIVTRLGLERTIPEVIRL